MDTLTCSSYFAEPPWYVVRLYDANEVLVDDGLYFAFSRLLRGIKVSGASALPAAGGHREARIEFEHEAVATIEVSGAQKLEAQSLAGYTVFTAPAACEQVDWQIAWPGDPPLKCATRIERVWWGLGNVNKVPETTDWASKSQVAKRGDFRASSDKAIWIRLPRPAWVENFHVGFSRNSAHCYRASASERELIIPLREFESSEELRCVGVSSLNCWLTYDGTETSFRLGSVEVIYQCKYCQQEFKNSSEMRSHALIHWEQLIRELTLDEMRRLLPELPVGSYKCSHCLRFVHSNDVENPTSSICWHIEHEHRGNPVRFYVVTDAEEFRDYILPSLPRIHRCRCGQEFTNANTDDFAAHLRSCQSVGELFTLT